MAKKTVLFFSHLQGLHYVRANESLPCYVYPTYHSLQDGDDLLNALKAGLRYFHDVDVALVVPITENLIPDPRFAPSTVTDTSGLALITTSSVCSV